MDLGNQRAAYIRAGLAKSFINPKNIHLVPKTETDWLIRIHLDLSIRLDVQTSPSGWTLSLYKITKTGKQSKQFGFKTHSFARESRYTADIENVLDQFAWFYEECLDGPLRGAWNATVHENVRHNLKTYWAWRKPQRDGRLLAQAQAEEVRKKEEGNASVFAGVLIGFLILGLLSGLSLL